MPKNVKVVVDDKVLRQLERKLAEAENMKTVVGVLQSGNANDVHAGSRATMVEIALIHEMGAPRANIPQRSFLQRTFEAKRRQVGIVAGKLAGKIIDAGLPVAVALDILGTWAAAEVKKTITEGEPIPPPLKPDTVAQKGSSRPLVDTGQLVNSITHEVRRGS